MNYKSKEIGMEVLNVLNTIKRLRELNKIGSEEHMDIQVQLQQELYKFGITTHGDRFFAIDQATEATKEIKLED